MQVTVLGGGHGCYAAAASLTEQGHEVTLWRRDKAALQPLLDKKQITLIDFNEQRDIDIAHITTDLKTAIDRATAIIIPLPALTHASLAENTASIWRDGQAVYLPPGTFGSYLFLQAARAAGNQADVSFAETGTLPYLARKQDATTVRISAYGKRLPTGVFPAKNAAQAFTLLEQVYPAIERIEDALSGALMNAGPIIHPPLITMNAGPLEHFDAWDIHNEGTQTSIRKVTDELDAERIRIREALGYSAPHFPLADHYSLAGEDWMYGHAAHEKLTDSGDWREHIILTEHRYMLEDVELGLAFQASCGDYMHVDCPVSNGILAMGSAINDRDFRKTGRTLSSLGLAQLELAQLKALLHDGI